VWAVAQEVQEGHNRGTQQKEEDQERAPNKERAPHSFVVYVDCLRAQALPHRGVRNHPKTQASAPVPLARRSHARYPRSTGQLEQRHAL
jgi:hypothetical protein